MHRIGETRAALARHGFAMPPDKTGPRTTGDDLMDGERGPALTFGSGSLLADPRDFYTSGVPHRLPDHPGPLGGAEDGLRRTFETMRRAARDFHRERDEYLTIYGDLGEVFAMLVLGMVPNRRHAKGSDGRVGNDQVEVKTITPQSKSQAVGVRQDRAFNKLFVVRVTQQHRVSGRLLDRSMLKFGRNGIAQVSWPAIQHLFPGEPALTLPPCLP